MDQKVKSIILLIIFILPAIITSTSVLSTTNDQTSKNNVTTTNIEINGNSELENFIATNGFSGSGTITSPYIIKDLIFNVFINETSGFNQSRIPLLQLKNTNMYVIIKNCSFNQQRAGSGGTFYFSNVSNVQILQNDFTAINNIGGILILSSGNITVKDNIFKNGGGIYLQSLINPKANEIIEICNNYFENIGRALWIQDQNYILIHDNYFKNNSDEAIYNAGPFDGSILTIYHNIFDSNTNGIYNYFLSDDGETFIFSNHFFNQKRYDLYFLMSNYTAIVYNNNFIYNSSYYIDLAIVSAFKQYNLTLYNGTEGNYFSGYNGKSINTYFTDQQSYYNFDPHPLEKPVYFNITIQGKIYQQPSFSKPDALSKLLYPIFLLGGFTVLIAILIIIMKKKRLF